MHSPLRLGVIFCIVLLSFGAAAADTPLVSHGELWRWHKGTNAPQASWQTIPDASLNSTWGGPTAGGLGYADNTAETNNCKTILNDMRNLYTTIYMRRSFEVTNAVDATNILKLTMDFDDGFIAWLDGVYLTNRFVTGAPTEPGNTATASGSHEASTGNSSPAPIETYNLGVVGSRLGAGTHVLAVIGLNQTLNSSDLIIVPDLSYGLPPTPLTMRWYASNSPIVVLTNVTVPALATLIIEPGTTVMLGTNIDITVANGGILLAEGSSNAPVLFTRAGTQNWGNLTVQGGVGSPESRISWARFDANGGSPCIDVAGGSVFLDHITFGITTRSYLHVDSASFIVQNCEFPTATAGFELVHGTGGIKSGGHGIFTRNFFGSGVGYNDIIDFTGGNRPGPILQVLDNVFVGSSDDELDLDGTDTWVEGNIFLHAHKNGAPDTSSAVSGGDDSGQTSEITVIGNIMYDCDHAAMGKGGNFYTFINNTVVHQTHVGGTDTNGAVIAISDEGFSQARGMYLEGNIIYDAENLFRFNTNALLTVTNNLMPFTWSGSGGNNSASDPQLTFIPQLSQTVFTNWASAQIMKQWFKPLSNSPAIGTGPNGWDKGGVIPIGASISGEPAGTNTDGNATLIVGINRSGNGIPTSSWPQGSGYTHYKWRLGSGAWSAETPIATPITLTGLSSGSHYIEVTGRRDTGFYQDDSRYGPAALVTRSQTWVVGGELDSDNDGIPDSWELAYGLDPQNPNDATLDNDSDGMNNLREFQSGTNPTNAASVLALEISAPPAGAVLQFDAVSNRTYTVEFRTSLSTGAWLQLQTIPSTPINRTITITNSLADPNRFYRVKTP